MAEKIKNIKSWHKNCICKTTSTIERLDSSSFEQQSSLIWRNLDHIMATNLKTHSLLRIMVEEIIWGQGILECVRFYQHQYILSSVRAAAFSKIQRISYNVFLAKCGTFQREKKKKALGTQAVLEIVIPIPNSTPKVHGKMECRG